MYGELSMLNAEKWRNQENTLRGKIASDNVDLESQIREKFSETEETVEKAIDNWLAKNIARRGCWR